jgi:hypothetical protein
LNSTTLNNVYEVTGLWTGAISRNADRTTNDYDEVVDFHQSRASPLARHEQAVGRLCAPEACHEAADHVAPRACSAQTDQTLLRAASGQLPRDVPPRNASQNDDVTIARDDLGFGLLPDLEELRRCYYYLARGNVGRDHLVEHLRKLLG